MPSDSCDHRRTTTTTVKPHHITNHIPGAPPPEPEHLPCPRCDSTNTKFCYYNNYNFSQPRHFCKACRRYWTHGGTLRDIPVGGGSRKNAKRSRLTNTTNTLEFRHMAPPNATPILIPFAGEHGGGSHFGKPAVSSFTSLLNSTQGPAGFFGFEDGRPIWPFSGIGDCGGGGYFAAVGGGGGGGNMTWQMESGEGGSSGECFTLPDLMI